MFNISPDVMIQTKTALFLCIVLLQYCLITRAVVSRGCVYTDYVDSSPCSHTCGVGVKTQVRVEILSNSTNAEPCHQNLTKLEACDDLLPCPTDSPPQSHVYVHQPVFNPAVVKPLVAAGATTAGALGIVALLGETLASVAPLLAIFGKREVPEYDEKYLLDLYIRLLQEKRKQMK